MSVAKKMLAAVFGSVSILMSVFVGIQPASASTAVNMNLVCQQNMHSTSWGAKLINSSTVYGWKCWNRAYPEQYWLGPFYPADVNYYCTSVEGTTAYFTNSSDPYSWRCH